MILRKLFAVVVVSVLHFSAYAQSESEKPHFISLNVGTSVPLKDYQALDTLNASNVNVGLSFSLEGGLYFNKFLGLGLSVGGFSNAVDRDDMSKQIQKELNESGMASIKADDWVNVYAMLGPYLSFGGEVIVVDFKFLGGIMNSQKPLITITTDESGEPLIQKNHAEDAFAFGFNYGVHLRVKLIGGLGLRINAEGVVSEQEFKNKVDYIRGSGTISKEKKITTEFKTLNLGVGLVFNF